LRSVGFGISIYLTDFSICSFRENLAAHPSCASIGAKGILPR
jgi:hypothetical protein